jgi:hypothetical protein
VLGNIPINSSGAAAVFRSFYAMERRGLLRSFYVFLDAVHYKAMPRVFNGVLADIAHMWETRVCITVWTC